MTLDDLADTINRMKPGQSFGLDLRQHGPFRFNTWLYSDWKHALRAKIIGSSFGTLLIRDGFDYSVVFEKCEEGERVYDRDGYPVKGG